MAVHLPPMTQLSALNAQRFPMKNSRFEFHSDGSWRAGMRVMLAVALALVLGLPVVAADSRAVKTRIAPVYPEIAKRMRITGEVRIEVTVDPEGKVTDVKKVSGNSMLSAAAEDAVRKWRFEPGSEISTVEITLNFALAQ
jgi:TonB family protein